MNAKDILEMKDILMTKRNTLTERVDKIQSSKMRDEPLSADTGEQSLELENDEVIDALDEMEERELHLINDAIKRIEEGGYGECISCGEDIDIPRLKALPFTPLCLGCADPVKTIN